MKQLTAENIEKTYGEKTLFRDLSFVVSENEKIGLIGINGTGKSSLMRLIAGIDGADSGSFKHPNDYRIQYLPQEPDLAEGLTVLNAVFESNAPVIQQMREYEEIMDEYEKNPQSDELQRRVLKAQEGMDKADAWDANSQAKIILSKLGVHDIGAVVGTLSGGQKKRVALAKVLIETPDLLLLDEPTNHLDYEAILWLEEFLRKYSGSVIIVSHDRYFLDQVSTRMIEIDQGRAFSYKGNYQSFIEAKAQREEEEQQSMQKMKSLYRNELAWMRKGAKARTTKQKARIQRFETIEQEVGTSSNNDQLSMGMTSSRLGKSVIELQNISKGFNERTLFQDVNLLVQRTSRIGIIGKNGTGKSTLLNIIAKRLEPDQGTVDIGQTVKLAYFSQEIAGMDGSQRMIEYIREGAEVIQTEEGSASAAQMLERFLFPLSTHGTPIYKLSGGEKRRLYLLRLLMERPNVLLLDEPTNDLDTETLTVLEQFIEEFQGAVITVSHDRYFLDKVAEHLLVLKPEGKVELIQMDYSSYLKREMENVKAKAEPIKIEGKEPKKKKKLSYLEKKEWEEIDSKIAQAEEKIESLDQEMQTIGSDFDKAERIMAEQQKTNEELEQLIERWDYLSEFAE
ncbi:ABC-F family ATP-binding cassette domain-containing protein [Jeotgalibacillus sp. ET6]|uniref:ABC-F family ATP-binding cassette domain-containing protein n=1 Tax=Jeotgalibacillus sp. ET6 TaxID=3037260 RepID=UPI002418A834|nr:ABC-F family ATP-binding cassette domain-containing protein [Jeotgalibacillus sp. ET6]MDG5470580.1 ABC-F family ATP-binding cassette domain-containing protein [Jeotgalibacillus sp. ET6]